jgi:hypothetical protein
MKQPVTKHIVHTGHSGMHTIPIVNYPIGMSEFSIPLWRLYATKCFVFGNSKCVEQFKLAYYWPMWN